MELLQGFSLVEPSTQLADFRMAAETQPTEDMSPGEIAARRLMQESPVKFAEIWEALERIHAEKEKEFLRRQDEQQAREREANKEIGVMTQDQTDLGADKVGEKLRELKERAES